MPRKPKNPSRYVYGEWDSFLDTYLVFGSIEEAADHADEHRNLMDGGALTVYELVPVAAVTIEQPHPAYTVTPLAR
jgi:hypothetical protein